MDLNTQHSFHSKGSSPPPPPPLYKNKKTSASSHFSCLLEFLKQGFISPQGEGESPFLVVHGVHGQVVNDISQEMGSLHRAAWCIIAQGSEMHVQVLVGGLVVQVDPQLGAGHAKTLHYGLLQRGNKDQLWQNRMDGEEHHWMAGKA